MKVETKSTLKFAFAVSSVFLLLVALPGCKKEQPTAQQSAGEQAMTAAKESEPAMAAEAAVAATAEQTVCPVMEGKPINKAVFVEYEGKKVYFCCQACPEKFLADPNKYIAKLPQFKE